MSRETKSFATNPHQNKKLPTIILQHPLQPHTTYTHTYINTHMHTCIITSLSLYTTRREHKNEIEQPAAKTRHENRSSTIILQRAAARTVYKHQAYSTTHASNQTRTVQPTGTIEQCLPIAKHASASDRTKTVTTALGQHQQGSSRIKVQTATMTLSALHHDTIGVVSQRHHNTCVYDPCPFRIRPPWYGILSIFSCFRLARTGLFRSILCLLLSFACTLAPRISPTRPKIYLKQQQKTNTHNTASHTRNKSGTQKPQLRHIINTTIPHPP